MASPSLHLKLIFRILTDLCVAFVFGFATLFFLATYSFYRASDIPGTRASMVSSTQYRVELTVSAIVAMCCLCFMVYEIRNYIGETNRGWTNLLLPGILLIIILILLLAIL